MRADVAEGSAQGPQCMCRRLSLADRATMVPLLAAVVDFDSSQATYEQYDSMTAKELFQK